jgi:hypothetical protein
VWHTTPQYVLYNAVLRRWPEAEYERMKLAGNLFPTTIAVLVSAVQKIARAMKLPEGLRLFRGLGGLVDLPKEFFMADEQGRKGFVEWGFMSTTAKEEVGRVPSWAGCNYTRTRTHTHRHNTLSRSPASLTH